VSNSRLALELWQTFAVVLVPIALWAGSYATRRWWPWQGREAAQADARPNDIPPALGWTGPRGNRWHTNRQARKNDWYRLDLGKPRVVRRVRVFPMTARQFPKRYALWVQDSDTTESYLECETEGPIDYVWNQPKRIVALEFRVVVPNEDERGDRRAGWSVSDVEIHESLLLRSPWPTRVIGGRVYDK
jgi:hypothetical protein